MTSRKRRVGNTAHSSLFILKGWPKLHLYSLTRLESGDTVDGDELAMVGLAWAPLFLLDRQYI